MNLFIVESPLQLLCAYEAIQKYESKKYILLLRQTGRGLNDLHLKNCVIKLDLEYQEFILRTEYIKFDFLRSIFFWICIFCRKYEIVYLGSFYSSALRLIKKGLRADNFFYMDDGAATLRAQSEIRKNIHLKVNWFTFFNLHPVSNQEIHHHNFQKLKEVFSKEEKLGSYFIGQPIEFMMGFEKKDYIRCVRSIAQNFSATEPLKYIPHRIENIKYIENIENIEIKILDLPIELYFLSSNVAIPKVLYSCYSTALISLKSIFPEVDVVYIKNNNNIQKIEQLETVYQYFEEYDVRSVHL